MSTSATEVFRAEVPSVGLTLKVRASVDGKQAAYEKRIREDADYREQDLMVEYSANADWKVTIAGGQENREVAAGEKVSDKPVFFETKYFFRGDFKDPKGREIADVQINHRLASVGDCFNFDDGVLVGALDFINEPGRFRLELKIVYKDRTQKVVSLEFCVVSVKLNILRDYDSILDTIEKVRPKLSQEFLGKSFWGAALNGDNQDDDRTWYQILSEVYEYYVQACRRIVNNPHQRYVRVEQFQRVDRVKRWTPELARQFNRLDPKQREHSLLRNERVEGAIDTPENRFVLYTLKELSRRLTGFADEQDKNDLVSKTWIAGVRDMSAELQRLSRHKFFTPVGRFSGFRQQSLVMQKQAGYAQVFAVWFKLKRALKPGGDDVDMSYRPISMLYEFWCFLKIRELLKQKFGEPTRDEVEVASEDELLDTPELSDESKIDDGKLSKCVVEFAQGEVKYTLTYQKTYGTHPQDGSAYSSLNPQRPDIVLTIAADGNEYSYLFDAKYRIWSMPKQGQTDSTTNERADADATTRDAIDAMYRYRDAILYRLQKAKSKREIIGAYVLYPGRCEPHLYERYRNTIDEEGVGAIPVLPGFLSELEANLKKIYDRHTPSDHLDVATSVRGTSTVVGEAFSVDAIDEVKLTPNELHDVIFEDQHRWISVPDEIAARIKVFPTFIRLVSTNKAEVVVKLIERRGIDPDQGFKTYNVEWVPEGNR